MRVVKQGLGSASARACALLSTCVSLSLSAMSELLRASPFEGSVCVETGICILERLHRQIHMLRRGTEGVQGSSVQ